MAGQRGYGGQHRGVDRRLRRGDELSYSANGLRILYNPNMATAPGFVGAPGVVRVPGGVAYLPNGDVCPLPSYYVPPNDMVRAPVDVVEEWAMQPIRVWRGPGVGQGSGGYERDGVITTMRPDYVRSINIMPDSVVRRPGRVEKELGAAEEQIGPVEKELGPIEEELGPVEKEPGPVEKEPGLIEKQPGPVEPKPESRPGKPNHLGRGHGTKPLGTFY